MIFDHHCPTKTTKSHGIRVHTHTHKKKNICVAKWLLNHHHISLIFSPTFSFFPRKITRLHDHPKHPATWLKIPKSKSMIVPRKKTSMCCWGYIFFHVSICFPLVFTYLHVIFQNIMLFCCSHLFLWLSRLFSYMEIRKPIAQNAKDLSSPGVAPSFFFCLGDRKLGFGKQT